MRVKRFYLSVGVSGFQTASIDLGVPDDISDAEIPFDELWDEMCIDWSHVEIERSEDPEIEEVCDSEDEPDCVIKRDGDKIVVAE